MPRPLITLPCTAQELKNALHAVCDHWYGYFKADLKKMEQDKTKGETK